MQAILSALVCHLMLWFHKKKDRALQSSLRGYDWLHSQNLIVDDSYTEQCFWVTEDEQLNIKRYFDCKKHLIRNRKWSLGCKKRSTQEC